MQKKYGPGMDGWMDGWVGGWMGGWVDGRAVLRIAYSNQKTLCLLKQNDLIKFGNLSQKN